MTGYGKAVVTYGDKKINIEVKSLNSKALDLSTRICPLYREKEIEIRQTIAQKLERGKVDFALWTEKNAASKAYYKQVIDVVNSTGIPQPEDIFATLLRMPDVMSKIDIEELSDEEWDIVRLGVDKALTQLIEFRLQEGAALQKKFEEKIDNIQALLQAIEPYEKIRVEKIRQRIIDGLSTIPEVDYDKNRLEQELIYYIEKLDISEEKQRLTNHLKYFRETMYEDGRGVGKKLGFIAQEMGREINTTGSKSNHAEMQNIVVKMKDELEQIKEQVLNAL